MNASHVLVYVFLFIFVLGCLFQKGTIFDKGTTLEELGSVIIDETKEDTERIEAASNYCNIVQHCLEKNQIVPKEVVLKSFQIDKILWMDDTFAYGFRIKSQKQGDLPYNSCSVVCYFDGDEVCIIDFGFGTE